MPATSLRPACRARNARSVHPAAPFRLVFGSCASLPPFWFAVADHSSTLRVAVLGRTETHMAFGRTHCGPLHHGMGICYNARSDGP